MKPGKQYLFKFILKESGIKRVCYYGNAKVKLKSYEWTTSLFSLLTTRPLSCKNDITYDDDLSTLDE